MSTATQMQREITATSVRSIDVAALSESVMLMSFSFFWGVGKVRQTEVEVETNADKTQLRHQKVLFDEETFPELRAIRQADYDLRRYVESLTCQYAEGILFLPTKAYDLVNARMKDYAKRVRPILVEAMLEKYDEQVAKRQQVLGDQFEASDYPSKAEVRRRFRFEYSYFQIKVDDKLKSIDAEAYDQEKAKLQEQMNNAAAEVRAALRHAVSQLVGRLAEVLQPAENDGKRRIFKTAVVDNVHQFLSTFDLRNITSDVALQAEIEKLKEVLHGVTAADIKSSDGLKSHLADILSVSAKQLQALTDEAPSRRFR